MNEKKVTVGIFGGSFNPIHRGHIGLAKYILRVAKLDEVWFMVSPLNPLKQGNNDMLDDQKRYELTLKALADIPQLQASDFELHLPKPSYTWRTLQELSKAYPQHKFHLIIGADNWRVFNRWYHAEDILNNYNIIIYPRQDNPQTTDLADNNTLRHSLLEHSPRSLSCSPLLAEQDEEKLPLFNISSTEVRQRIKQGKSVARLLPNSIIAEATEYYK